MKKSGFITLVVVWVVFVIMNLTSCTVEQPNPSIDGVYAGGNDLITVSVSITGTTGEAIVSQADYVKDDALMVSETISGTVINNNGFVTFNGYTRFHEKDGIAQISNWMGWKEVLIYGTIKDGVYTAVVKNLTTGYETELTLK
jgi:hypothetical protein